MVKRKASKTVRFHPTAFVVLIPTSDEYHRAGLGTALWWDNDDFHSFKMNAFEEFKEFVRLYPNGSAREILKKYYESLLSDDEGGEEEGVYSISPDSVAELTQMLETPPVSAEANFLFRSSSECRRQAGVHIERPDSVQLYKSKLEDLDMPGIDVDSNLSSSNGGSPQISPHVTDNEEFPSKASNGFLGLVPILANAAALLILSLVQNE